MKKSAIRLAALILSAPVALCLTAKEFTYDYSSPSHPIATLQNGMNAYQLGTSSVTLGALQDAIKKSMNSAGKSNHWKENMMMLRERAATWKARITSYREKSTATSKKSARLKVTSEA